MIHIDQVIQAGGWPDEDSLAAIAHLAINAAVKRLVADIQPDSEVSLVFTNDEEIQNLNKQWRGQDKPTNVLSFAANEAGGPITPILGDIVLAFETIDREAKEQGKDFDNHLKHLIIHGFLHLLGYDHISDEEADEMEALEILIMKDLGIADPYAST